MPALCACVCGRLSVLSPSLIVSVSHSLIPSLSFHTVSVSLSVSDEAFVVTQCSTRARDAGVVASVVLQLVMYVLLCCTVDGWRYSPGRQYSHFTVLA